MGGTDIDPEQSRAFFKRRAADNLTAKARRDGRRPGSECRRLNAAGELIGILESHRISPPAARLRCRWGPRVKVTANVTISPLRP